MSPGVHGCIPADSSSQQGRRKQDNELGGALAWFESRNAKGCVVERVFSWPKESSFGWSVRSYQRQRACWWKVGGVGWMLGVPLDDVVAVVQAQVQRSPSIFYVVNFLPEIFAFISTYFSI